MDLAVDPLFVFRVNSQMKLFIEVITVESERQRNTPILKFLPPPKKESTEELTCQTVLDEITLSLMAWWRGVVVFNWFCTGPGTTNTVTWPMPHRHSKYFTFVCMSGRSWLWLAELPGIRNIHYFGQIWWKDDENYRLQRSSSAVVTSTAGNPHVSQSCFCRCNCGCKKATTVTKPVFWLSWSLHTCPENTVKRFIFASHSQTR